MGWSDLAQGAGAHTVRRRTGARATVQGASHRLDEFGRFAVPYRIG